MYFLGRTNLTGECEVQQESLVHEEGLSLPRILWCPDCGIHTRHQDQRSYTHRLLPRCPVCQDIYDKEQEEKEKEMNEGARSE